MRRQEQKGHPELKRSRWLWLWNPERLTPDQRGRLHDLLDPPQIALDTAELLVRLARGGVDSTTYGPRRHVM